MNGISSNPPSLGLSRMTLQTTPAATSLPLSPSPLLSPPTDWPGREERGVDPWKAGRQKTVVGQTAQWRETSQFAHLSGQKDATFTFK